MTSPRSIALLLTGLVAASACAGLDDAGDDREDNGGTATMLRAAVGFLAGGSRSCTGTLIRPDRVLTAGHCDDNQLFQVQDTKGADYSSAVIDFVEVTGYEHRGANQETDENIARDLAILQLETPLPGVIAPLAVASGPLDGETLVDLVGYGETAVGARDWGTKRTIETYATPLAPLPLLRVAKDGRNVACFGDSGAPLLLWRDDGFEVVGVFSSGPAASCTWGTAVDVFEMRGWLRNAHAALD